jgi:hypothetical protein
MPASDNPMSNPGGHHHLSSESGQGGIVVEIDKIMRQHGFSRLEDDGYYVKEINYDGEPAFISITGLKVCGVPETLDEPILVMMYNCDFDEIREAIEVESLRTYISSLKGGSVFCLHLLSVNYLNLISQYFGKL